ncbi:protein mono-ADP-ribosyltransferase PARP14 [Nematolebias whitei]|uniref:protein mono-ADP-ribosyltransferase PARP14 n=1 Tax=Nematolebias whitei TaxID=451745 RepID=UPI001898214D|nr:protein mono-ADP-ribosyltransferase PARP14 [Nematolebias whitei]
MRDEEANEEQLERDATRILEPVDLWTHLPQTIPSGAGGPAFLQRQERPGGPEEELRDANMVPLRLVAFGLLAAAVCLSPAADVERFVSVSRSHAKIRKLGLRARPLEAAKSIRVESLPPTAVKDMLELWFEKNWVLPDNVQMIPEEQAAIVSFSDTAVVESICVKEDHVMRSIPVKVYPYYESLGTALYGKERPAWKMPEAFTEKVHHAIWKFLLRKKLLKSLNDQMRPHFCSIELDDPEVKLRPLPSFLRQNGLTAQIVGTWKQSALEAFRHLMSQYSAFECDVNIDAWKAAEKEVRSVVNQDAVPVFDASREVLIVAGRANDMKKIRAPVENIVLKAKGLIERQTKGVSEVMIIPPARIYILKQEGLLKAASDISSELNLSYDERTERLTIKGLPEEVYKTKAWILERIANLKTRKLNVHQGLVEYLRTMDPKDMSEKLFTSQGISAIYSVDTKGLTLLGSSDQALSDADAKMKAALLVETFSVEDQKVMNLQSWVDLNKKLLDTYNCSDKKTVNIWMQPERGARVTVAGFVIPVNEVSRSLKEFIGNYSQVQETVRVKSCAVVQFVEKKQTQLWLRISKDNDVSVLFDPERPKIVLSGARLHVQKAKSSFQELVAALSADTLTVDKPGAKKYFQSQGSYILNSILSDLSCVVMLQSEIQEEEEEDYDDEASQCYCKVQTSGVLVCVSKADICSFNVDAVVNAANEELQHIGGLALALLRAAGPQLQEISNDYVAKNGNLCPGDAITTNACNLPCKYVVHAVGPRYSDSDKNTSVSHLKSAVKESLRQAEVNNCSSIALPAISSGVFGFPVPLCAETIARAVREYCDGPQGPGSLTEVHLVDNNDGTVRIMAAAVKAEFTDLGPIMTVPQQTSRKNKGAAGGHQKGRGKGAAGVGRGAAGAGRGAEGAGRGGRFPGNFQTNRGGQRGPNQRGEYGGSGRMEQVTPDGLKIVLCKGNIQDQTTDVIVNTIAATMDLQHGAVSRALLEAAGDNLQVAILTEAGVSTLQYGDVVITDGCNLRCQKVFHAVCPYWDNGGGQAEKELISIIACCLKDAERHQMTSLSFPAIGTGNLGFPRDLVSRVLLREVQLFSCRKSARHLREVVIVVHPSDDKTVDCFSREFSGETGPNTVQHPEVDFTRPAPSRSQSASASETFSAVLSPSLGVYQMQMGQLALEVSSGDITKETCDVIVNSSNQNFDLYAGVSKAILDSAGRSVLTECSQIVNSPGYLPRGMILTSAGQLPARFIVHVVGQNDPVKIKDIVKGVLKLCEENKVMSVAFPALGTGQGGVNPSAVADAMVDAVVEFVRKKRPKSVRSVKILIFQTAMLNEFHISMKKRQGEDVEEKGIMGKIIGTFASMFVRETEQRNIDLSLEKEEFEPAVFQLCADNQKAVGLAKKRINELIVAEQATRTITDQYINQLTQADVEKLQSLQRELTVSIHLDRGQEDQEPRIHLEGLTREVFSAESAVRDIIRKVERSENLKNKAILVSGLVEWKYLLQNGSMVPFDIDVNLQLEEALEKKQTVQIKIKNNTYVANPELKTAVSKSGRGRVELLRKDLKAQHSSPPHWEDMKGDIVKMFPLTPGSTEYNNVMGELTKHGLALNIIEIKRVQNATLWQSYQLLKNQMEVKNKHKKNEQLLFHGTAATSIDLINQKGFNRSYAGQHGAMYGKGSYFAVNPAYSQNYAQVDTQGHRNMYQAQVLVGDYTQGMKGMISPPAKSGNAADLYDSVTDNLNTPTMFVIFNDIQAYPEYLITFS